MATVTTLKIAFNTADQKKRTLSISPARTNINAGQALAFGNALITSGAFIWEPTEVVGAELINTTTNKLAV